MSPIRPYPAPQSTAPARPAPEAGRTAAQRAFFQAALGGAQAAAPAAPVEPVQPAARFTAQPRMQTPSEPPTRILRPGSFIDIKV